MFSKPYLLFPAENCTVLSYLSIEEDSSEPFVKLLEDGASKRPFLLQRLLQIQVSELKFFPFGTYTSTLSLKASIRTFHLINLSYTIISHFVDLSIFNYFQLPILLTLQHSYSQKTLQANSMEKYIYYV